MGKKILKNVILISKEFFLELFLFVSCVNLFEVYGKERKKLTFLFNTLKMAVKGTVVILTALAVSSSSLAKFMSLAVHSSHFCYYCKLGAILNKNMRVLCSLTVTLSFLLQAENSLDERDVAWDRQ
jgi:hypothetical protein